MDPNIISTKIGVRPPNSMHPAVIVIVLLVLIGIAIGAIFYFRSTEKSTNDGWLILPNRDGTYRITRDETKKTSYPNSKPQKESFDENSEEIPRYAYIRTDQSIIQQMMDGQSLYDQANCEHDSCRRIDMANANDMLFYMNKFHEDFDAVPLQELKEHPAFAVAMGLVDVQKHDPLTLRFADDSESNENGYVDIVVGSETGQMNLATGYQLTLISLKRDGKPLPKPDPSQVYALQF